MLAFGQTCGRACDVLALVVTASAGRKQALLAPGEAAGDADSAAGADGEAAEPDGAIRR